MLDWLFGEDKPREQGARSGHWETVNPRKYRMHHRASTRDAVEFYKRNPDGRYDSCSGEPFVMDGVFMNGNHRVQAAKETGRRIRVWVEDSR